MIKRIRELIKAKDDVDLITKNIEMLNKSVGENNIIAAGLRNQLEVIKSDLVQTKLRQNELLDEFGETILSVKNIREDFAREIVEFKLLKAQMQKKILEKFEEELSRDLDVNREGLRKDSQDYNELRKKVHETLTKMNAAAQEVNKFLEISRSIKKEDFELTKFARHLIEMDGEKLSLMNKIDNLERMVSKMRRGMR